MIFVDTWAWIGMADDTDQYHAAVIKQHRKLLKKNRRYVTTDDVVGELIDTLYDATAEPQARDFIRGLRGFAQKVGSPILVRQSATESANRGGLGMSVNGPPIAAIRRR